MMRPRALACLLMFTPLLASGATGPWPRIDAIRYEGNAVTRPSVIERELTVEVGDAADPAAIEASRQAVLDLGLFREVEIKSAPVGDAAVALIVKVREKRYLLPLPRIDTSSDKDVSYGAQLRWSNVGGRNHRLDLTVQDGKFPEDRRREREREASIGYSAPYFGRSEWGGSLRAEYVERLTPAGNGNFQETFHRVEALAIRDFSSGRPRHGWRLGAGLLWEDQVAEGPLAPPSDGVATALVGIANYSDLRFHVYSETGRRFAARMQAAADGWGSDYGYTRWQANYFESREWGERAHQTWHVLGLFGQRSGGPGTRDEFFLGGSGRLRGYESDFLQGDRVYYGAVEWLRPLGRDWLRGMALLEVGGTDSDVAGLRDGSAFANLGLGVRMRLTWFVDVEIELGVAYPLRGDGGARFFAGGN
jgi:outer membrane protein assembly factor BamA